MARHKAIQKPLGWGTTHEAMIEWYIQQADFNEEGCLITHLSGTPYGKTIIKFLDNDSGQSVTGKSHHVALHRYIYCVMNNIDYISMDPRRMIRHKCSNKKCINIEHLIEGSAHDNNMDALYAGDNPTHKLNPDLVRQLRKRFEEYEGDPSNFYSSWAKELNIGYKAIYDVIKYRTWSEV